MNRNSLIYKTRRKIQTFAYSIIPHDKLSEFYYKIYLHKKLNLKNPQTLNEKLQWYKLYYCPDNPLVAKCTDKYEVRDYVVEKGYGDILTKLLGVWDKASEIKDGELPERFVLKCTHGCAYNILCKNKAEFDFKSAKKQLDKWMKENFAAFNVEVHYEKITKPRVICEEYLGDVIIDYKFFCFHGEPKFFYVSSDLVHDRQAEMGFFDMNCKKILLIRDDYKDIGEITIPSCYSEMVKVARRLSEDFPFVRVDFFLIGHSYHFAELTFTPGAAMMPINPDKYDVEWGKWIDISKEMES